MQVSLFFRIREKLAYLIMPERDRLPISQILEDLSTESQRKHCEVNLRKKYPAVQDAWEKYESMLRLHKDCE